MAYEYNLNAAAVWLAACGTTTSSSSGSTTEDPPTPPPCSTGDEPCEDCDECEDEDKKKNCCDNKEPTYTPLNVPVTSNGFYEIGGSCSLNFKYRLINGELFVNAKLFSESTNSAVPLNFSLIYRTTSEKNNLLGIRWNQNYDLYVIEEDDDCYYYNYDGNIYHFKYENGQYTSPLHRAMTAVMTKTNGLFRLTYPTGMAYQFNEMGKLAYIQSPELIKMLVLYDKDLHLSEIQAIDITDESYLRTIKFSIDKKRMLIEKLTCPDDEEIVFQYNNLNMLESIVTSNGCNFALEYDSKSRLKRIKESSGKEYVFSYNSNNYLSRYTEAPGKAVERSQNFSIESSGSGEYNAYIEDFVGNKRKVRFLSNRRPYEIYDSQNNILTQWYSGTYNYYYKVYQPDGTFRLKYLEYTGVFPQENIFSRGIPRSDINEDWRGSSYLHDSNDRLIAQYDMNLDIATLGDWTDGTDRVYGKDGFILCAWNNNENWTDYLDGIPSYLDQNTPVEKVDTVQFNGGSSYDERSLLQPSGTGRRRTNWDTAAGEHSFTVTVNFSSSTPCDITTYSFPTYSYYGREYAVNVTDKNGTQTLYVHNDYNSIYCRFSVEPDDNNRVVLEFVGAPTSTGYILPRVSALFFDPQETHVTRYEYTDENYPRKVTKTIDAYGNEATTQYNADGTVAQSSNFRGKVTKYTYTGDSYARITCVEDPLGNKTWTNYDTKGRVVSTVDARGAGPDDEDHMTKNEYDDDGNLISVTDPLGNKTTYLYDGTGKLISQTDPTGWVTYYTDGGSGSTEVKDALGRVISSTDEDGKTTYYEYDIDSHLIKITDPNGAISTNTYDAIGRMTASSDFEGSITRYEYDVMGRTTKTTAPDGGETSYQYDVKGRITKTTYPDETTAETTYDIYGNTKTETDRNGDITEYYYDRLNRVIKIKDPAGNYTYYEYDENGNRTSVRDPRSSGPDDDTYKVSYTYDDNDRLTRTDYPDETYETIAYDAVGNVTSRTDRKGQATTYTYDNANRLTQITYHDSSYMKYTYDASGRTISREDPDSSTIYYENNSTFRREIKLDSGESLVYDYYWIYDENGRLSRFMDCTEATVAKYNEVEYRENVNKIGYSSTAILGQNFKYGEEGAGNRKYRQGTPDSRIRMGKIKCGLDGIQYGSAPGVLITGYNYDDDGTLASMTGPYGNEFSFNSVSGKSRTNYPNNTCTERTFDQYGRLSAIIHKKTNNGAFPGEYGSETVLESFAYDYDDNGNITRITYASGEYTDYTYDSLNRLTSEHRKTYSGATIYKIEYKFDNNAAKNGNIHQVLVNDTDTTTFTYDEMNQLTAITHPDTSTETLTYDNNGNLSQTTKNDEITTYEWNCFDLLTKVTLPNGEIVEFDYDEDGMLVKQKSEGIERKFIQNNRYTSHELVKNRNGEWETTANHIIHNQMLSSYIHSNSIEAGNKTNTIFYHMDHLGSVRLITDANGNPIDSISTDAYGNPLPHADSQGNQGAKMLSEFNFIGTHGIRYVKKIRLHNMRARWYKRLIERFVSFDKVEDTNRYQYTNWNPITFIDIYGKQSSKAEKEYLDKRIDFLDFNHRKFTGNYGSYLLEINKSSCQYMIRVMRSLAGCVTSLKCPSVKAFMDLLSQTFMTPHLPWENVYKLEAAAQAFAIYPPFVKGGGIRFLGTGFKEMYSDRPEERKKTNQPFHLMAYILMAYKHGAGWSEIAATIHEIPFEGPGKSAEDMALGKYGASMGSNMTQNDSETNKEELERIFRFFITQLLIDVCKYLPDV